MTAAPVRDADGWHLSVDGDRRALPDITGMGILARLLATPGADVGAAELAGRHRADAPPSDSDLAEDVRPASAHTRLATLSDGRSIALLVFEQPDAEPLPRATCGRRGPVDHLPFVVDDHEAFDAAARRLVDAGASTGEARPLGPTLSLPFVDPDGRHLSLQRSNPDWDPATIGADPGLDALITG